MNAAPVKVLGGATVLDVAVDVELALPVAGAAALDVDDAAEDTDEATDEVELDSGGATDETAADVGLVGAGIMLVTVLTLVTVLIDGGIAEL